MSEPSRVATIALLLVIFFAVGTLWREQKPTVYRICETDSECAASIVVNGQHVIPMEEGR